jgi:hypothetical protein
MAAGQVNGQAYQHALIDLSSSARQGVPFLHRKFKSLKFSDEGMKEPVYDAHGEQIQYVIKPRKTDGSITMLLDEWDLWRDWLYQQAALLTAQLQRPIGPGQVEFTMTVSVGVTLAASRTRRVRAMVQKEDFDSDDGQDPLKAEIPLYVIDITDEFGRRFVERG